MTTKRKTDAQRRNERIQRLLDHECVRVASINAYDVLRDLEYKADGRYRAALVRARRAVTTLTAMAVEALYVPGTGQLLKAVRR